MLSKIHIVINEEPGINLFTAQNILDGFHTKKLKNTFGFEFSESLALFEGGYVRWSVNKDNWWEIGQKLLEGIKSCEIDFRLIHRGAISSCEEALKASSLQALGKANFADASNLELVKFLVTAWEKSTEMHYWGFTPVAIDYEHHMLSNELLRIAKSRIAENKLDVSTSGAINILTSPSQDTAAMKENRRLLFLANEITKKFGTINSIEATENAINSEADWIIFLQNTVDDFDIYKYEYEGPRRSWGDFIELVYNLLQHEDIENRYLEAMSYIHDIPIKKKDLVQKLSLTDQEEMIFAVAADFAYLKTLRMETRSLINDTFDLCLTEIASRFEGLTLNDLRYYTFEEVIKLLNSNKLPILLSESKQRRQKCLYVAEGYKHKVLIGKDAEKLFDDAQITIDASSEVTEISGHVACLGYARGIVRIIRNKSDIGKVQKGDVLVASATSPDYLPAMHKACAFVTDQGGISSHASIVAREMKKPCIIGTKVATKVFKDGDLVEVDANNGTVRRING
jgi:phosphohistidine swiveling domain-containing protein